MKENYYEILNVPRDASREEIESAYRGAAEAYAEGALAAYSLYLPSERKGLLESLTKVYETLSDPAKRREYDEALEKAVFQEEREKFERYSPFNIQADDLSIGSMETVRFSSPLLVMSGTDTVAAEQYRILFTKLDQVSRADGSKVFALTSAVKGEGKTMTSLNLAYVAARDFRKRCLLIELDLKNPSLRTKLDSGGARLGVTEVLSGQVRSDEAMTRLDDCENLFFLQAGKSARNSTELLGSAVLEEIIRDARRDFDLVIVDCPPILPLADMSVISRYVDGMVLVIRAEATSRGLVKNALDSLTEGRVIGAVLNGAQTVLKKYYY